MVRRAVAWFRNDLRVRDNALLHHRDLQDAQESLAIYCIDPRHFAASSWGRHSRTAAHRARFLAESLEALGHSTAQLGSRLVVAVGHPEDTIPQLLRAGDVLAFQKEDTSEEQAVEAEMLRRLPQGVLVSSHWGQTLFDRRDLGFDPTRELPIPFGKFKFGICDQISPRPELPRPSSLPPPLSQDECAGLHPISLDATALTSAMAAPLPDANHDLAVALGGAQPAIEWRGGEAAGLARLQAYTARAIGTYHRTRNQLQGADDSSHLSPWLANGSLSVRTIYWSVKEFEKTQGPSQKDGKFDHVYKFIFQLSWRDYFRFYCARFGSSVFFVGGPARRARPWRRDAEAEHRWKHGRTGVPLVDALMRELLATGFIANRGRYIVASYLVYYLGIDWRVGADWFESLLLDHDVCSNYGEWASMAGVAAAVIRGVTLGLKGRGPSAGRSRDARGAGGDPWAKGVQSGDAVFDPWEQGLQYDRNESYVRQWVPEVRGAPKGAAHWPHDLSPTAWRAANCGTYPAPLAMVPFEFDAPGRSMSEHCSKPNVPRLWRRSAELASPSVSSSQSFYAQSDPKATAAGGRRRWNATRRGGDGQPDAAVRA